MTCSLGDGGSRATGHQSGNWCWMMLCVPPHVLVRPLLVYSDRMRCSSLVLHPSSLPCHLSSPFIILVSNDSTLCPSLCTSPQLHLAYCAPSPIVQAGGWRSNISCWVPSGCLTCTLSPCHSVCIYSFHRSFLTPDFSCFGFQSCYGHVTPNAALESWLWWKKRPIKHHSDTFSIQSWRFSIKKVFWLLSFPSSFFRQSLPTFLTFPSTHLSVSLHCHHQLMSSLHSFLPASPVCFSHPACFISPLLARCNLTPHLYLCIPTAAASLSSMHFPPTFSFSPFHLSCPSSGSWIISWQIQELPLQVTCTHPQRTHQNTSFVIVWTINSFTHTILPQPQLPFLLLWTVLSSLVSRVNVCLRSPRHTSRQLVK